MAIGGEINFPGGQIRLHYEVFDSLVAARGSYYGAANSTSNPDSSSAFARFYFESLDAQETGWCGLGIGASMQDADIVTCSWAPGSNSDAVDRTSSAYGVPQIDYFQGDTEAAGAFVPGDPNAQPDPGSTGCGFIRRVTPSTPARGTNKPLWDASTTAETVKTDLIAAWGPGFPDVAYHGGNRAAYRVYFVSASGTPLSPQEAATSGVVEGVSRRFIPLTYIAHAFVMLIVWAVLVPIAVLGIRLCPGQRQWLLDSHQNSMFLATSLTIPAATAAFIAKGTWNGLSLHGVLGVCIAVILVVQNVLGAGARAYFRPQQGVPQPSLAYVRWIHRALGVVTLSLTTANVCIGFSKLLPELWFTPILWFLCIAAAALGIAYYNHLDHMAAVDRFKPHQLQIKAQEHVELQEKAATGGVELGAAAVQADPPRNDMTKTLAHLAAIKKRSVEGGHVDEYTGILRNGSSWAQYGQGGGTRSGPATPEDESRFLKVTMPEVTERARAGEKLLVIAGLVIDVQGWMESHPGGTYSIEQYIGKDATKAFMGAESPHPSMPRAFHSDYARTLVQSMAVAKLRYVPTSTPSNVHGAPAPVLRTQASSSSIAGVCRADSTSPSSSLQPPDVLHPSQILGADPSGSFDSIDLQNGRVRAKAELNGSIQAVWQRRKSQSSRQSRPPNGSNAVHAYTAEDLHTQSVVAQADEQLGSTEKTLPLGGLGAVPEEVEFTKPWPVLHKCAATDPSYDPRPATRLHLRMSPSFDLCQGAHSVMTLGTSGGQQGTIHFRMTESERFQAKRDGMLDDLSSSAASSASHAVQYQARFFCRHVMIGMHEHQQSGKPPVARPYTLLSYDVTSAGSAAFPGRARAGTAYVVVRPREGGAVSPWLVSRVSGNLVWAGVRSLGKPLAICDLDRMESFMEQVDAAGARSNRRESTESEENSASGAQREISSGNELFGRSRAAGSKQDRWAPQSTVDEARRVGVLGRPKSRLMMDHLVGHNAIKVAFVCYGTGNVAWVDVVGWMVEEAMYPTQERSKGPGGFRAPEHVRILNVCGNEHDAVGCGYLRSAYWVLNPKHSHARAAERKLFVRLHAYLRSQSWADEKPFERSVGDTLGSQLILDLLTRSSAPEALETSDGAMKRIGSAIGSLFMPSGENRSSGGVAAPAGAAGALKQQLKVDMLVVCGPPKFEKTVMSACKEAGVLGLLQVRALTSGIRIGVDRQQAAESSAAEGGAGAK